MHKLAFTTLAVASALSPAILAAKSPPAGISWRDQPARPYVDLVDRAPPIAVDRGDDNPAIRRFVIRRDGGRDNEQGPVRVIVRREHLDDSGPDEHDHGPHHGGMKPQHDEMSGYHGDLDAYDDDDEWIDEGRDALQDHGRGHYENSDHDWADREQVYAPQSPAYGHVQGPCCSGGMTTETITTTTTYPPTVEKDVSYQHVAEHKPVRMYKRKLRRR